MFKKWFWLKALLALVLIGGLVSAGVGIYRVGWWRGFRMGQVTVGEDDGEAIPPPRSFDRFYSPRGLGFPYHRSRLAFTPLWFGGGLFLRAALLVMVLVLIGSLFRRHPWRTVCGPAKRYWHHGHSHHRHAEGEKASFVGKARPDAQTDVPVDDIDES